MPGPVPKDADRRQRRNKRGAGLVLANDADGRIVPEPPEGLLEVTREEWVALWSSALVEAVQVDTDMPVIRRLFRKRDEYLRAEELFRKERIVKGSTGQPVRSPAFKIMKDLEGQIVALEDRLGLNPKARAQLGITIGQMRKTIADLNRSLEWDDDEDPRVEAADEATA